MIDELNRPSSQKGKNSARNAVTSHRNMLFLQHCWGTLELCTEADQLER